MRRRLLTLLIFLGFLWPGILPAQKHYTVAHYTGDNGLPQNSVKGIAADTEGFIWIGTEDGLVRYDGTKFYLFNRFNLHLPSIFTRITSLRRVKRTGNWSADKPGMERNAVNYAFFNVCGIRIEKGRATPDTGYYYSRAKKISKIVDYNLLFHAEGVPSTYSGKPFFPYYMLIAGEDDSNFYICSKNRISYYSKWKNRHEINRSNADLWSFFTIGDWLYYLNPDLSLTGFLDKRIMEMAPAGDILNDPNFRNHKKDIRLFWNHISNQAYIYLEKNLYILNQNKGGELTTKLLVEDFDLIARGIEKVHYDRINQKVYLGSATEGLFILSKQRFQALTIDGNSRDNVFYGQIPYSDNSVLTSMGRIIGRDSVTGRVFTKVLKHIEKVNPTDKLTIIRDRDNTIWTKLGEDLFHIDNETQKVVKKWTFKFLIESIHQDKKGDIWVGLNGGGLYYIDRSKKDNIAYRYVKAPVLTVQDIESLSSDRLLAATSNGLFTIDLKAKKVYLVKGTNEVNIKSVHVFDKDHAWITAHEKGLMLLIKDKLTTFPLDKQKYLSSAHCVVNDGRGYLWIPTNNGLFKMSAKDLVQYAALKKSDAVSSESSTAPSAELFYMYFAKDEGLNTNEFNGSCEPCSAKLGNGYISLPSLSGFVWFKPENLSNQGPDGGIILDKVEVGRKSLPISGDTVRFPLNPQQVRLYFSTAYFGNDYNLNVSYALIAQNAEVLPSDWIPMNRKESDIRFSSLNSGNYTLLIRKLNGFGIKNYTIKKVYFIVPLFWYETWWTKVLLGLVLLAAVYFYNKFKIRKIKRENARLEEVVEKRTERLNVALVDLEESKTEMSRQIHMLSRLLTSMTHDVQSPLNYISLTSGGIRKMVDLGKLDDVSDVGDLISDSSKRMSIMLRDLLDYIKIQVYGNRMKFEEIELRPLVENKLEILKNVITLNRSVFSNDVPAGLMVFSDYQMLSIMIHNLIDNAAKFTHDGKICIQAVIHSDNKIELTISNTATGVPEELMEMINSTEEEHVSEFSGKPRKKAGMGLLIVKEVAALIGVNLKVTQTEMTRFHLFFE
ncbi:sensor histidine kinase [Dyadobacter diqingensis]|uniref:sensor histidine kinase n=1 Tax=Dyadobacter diqingensis TaxID=2938121 RepID=UPI0020C19210|nr:ATP-binding protein [Dyadobacter diqingensis]